jgi:hypothetical protein
MDLQEVGCEGVAWVLLAQDDEWQALVSADMNLHSPLKASNLLTGERLLPPQEGV